jgi:hypothetical protein
MKQRQLPARLECSICRSNKSRLSPYLDGHVCEDCAEKTCLGTDSTSHALRMRQRANRDQLKQLKGERTWISPEELEYRAASNQLMAEEILSDVKPSARFGSGGEVVNPNVEGLVNTLNDPTVAAAEASHHRTDLVTSLGNDIAAMALDASDTISASNSLEKMLAHQMAALHEAGMQMFRRANLMEDHAVAAKCMGAGVKACTAYQGALTTLDKIRGDKRQHIVVQHVNVGAGGQAVVGNVNTKGGHHA